jgi:hypothetical protein
MDLEYEYHGLMDEYNILKDLDKVEEILTILKALDVKLTVFAVGEIFERYPDVIRLFEKYNCEFETHSYTHDFDKPDSEEEIVNAKKAYFNFFNRDPIGYRAPRGKITDSGIAHLKRQGFLYDSSIFPSYFPNPFRYLLKNKKIHYYKDSGILEIPITSVSPFRLTLSISYIKLLGINFYLKQSMPDVICFDTHLHDLIVNESSFNKLPLIWKVVYSRNKHRGIELCVKFLEHVRQRGYRFCYMSELYNLYKQ